MPADRLTKALPKGRFPEFIKQLGLVDLEGFKGSHIEQETDR